MEDLIETMEQNPQDELNKIEETNNETEDEMSQVKQDCKNVKTPVKRTQQPLSVYQPSFKNNGCTQIKGVQRV